MICSSLPPSSSPISTRSLSEHSTFSILLSSCFLASFSSFLCSAASRNSSFLITATSSSKFLPLSLTICDLTLCWWRAAVS